MKEGVELEETNQEIQGKKDKNGWIKTILKVLVSLVFLFLIFFRINFKALWALINPVTSALGVPVITSKQNLGEIFLNVSKMDYRYIPFILLFIVLNYVVGAFRWKQLLIHEKSKDIPVKYLINLYFIGSFFNNFMPTSIGGDVFKMYQLGKKLEDKALGISSTFMERLTGMIALVLVSYIGLIFGMSDLIKSLPAAWRVNSLYILLFKILSFGGFWILAIIGFLSLGFLARKISFFKDIHNAILAYKDNKKVLLIAFLTSFIVQMFSILTQYFILLSLGITIPLDYAALIFPVIALAGFFIPSINSLGVQEFFYKELLALRGISNPLALGASLIYQFARLIISLIGGIFYALGKGD